MIFITRLFILIALISGSHATAQTINVRTLALRAGELPEVYLKNGEKYEKLRFSAVQPSSTVRAIRVNPLPLYKREKDAEGEDVYAVAHKIQIPTGAKGIMLLGWKSGDKIRHLAIKDDFSKARFNDWLLINTSKKSIAFKVGKNGKPFMVKAGSSKTYVIKSVKEGKGASVMAQAMFEEKMKLFFSTYWPVFPGKRTVVLFIEDGRKIRIKRISDKLVQVKKKAL